MKWIRGEKTIVNRYLPVLESVGKITESDLFDRRNVSLSLHDALWSVCNELLLEKKKVSDFDAVINLYHVLEQILVSEDKKANKIVKLRMEYELLRYKSFDCPIVITVCPKTECAACKEVSGKEFDIDVAIKTSPLPPVGCVCLRCACSY